MSEQQQKPLGRLPGRGYSRDISDRFFAALKRMLDAGMCATCASGAAIERAEKAQGREYTAVPIPCKKRRPYDDVTKMRTGQTCADILAAMRAQPDLNRREAPAHAGPLPPHRQKPAVAKPDQEGKKAS